MSEALVTSADAPQAAGRRLAAARADCGFAVADIARQLKLSPWQVEALEAGDYGRLPGTVFVRGFIRNYARLVKLDPAPLLASAERELPQIPNVAPEMPPALGAPFPTGRELRWHKYAIVMIVLVVPVVIFEFYVDEPHEVTVKSRPVTLPPPQPVREAEPAAEPPVVAEAAAEPPPAAPAVPRPREKARAEPAPLLERVASVEHNPGEQLVRFRFDQESWVEVRDRSGRKIFSQLNAAGTEQTVSGVPPLSLVVGNAAGVRLLYNEQPVDLAPHTKIDVARLTLE